MRPFHNEIKAMAGRQTPPTGEICLRTPFRRPNKQGESGGGVAVSGGGGGEGDLSKHLSCASTQARKKKVCDFLEFG